MQDLGNRFVGNYRLMLYNYCLENAQEHECLTVARLDYGNIERLLPNQQIVRRYTKLIKYKQSDITHLSFDTVKVYITMRELLVYNIVDTRRRPD